MNFTVNQELIIRLSAFLTVLVVIFLWEKLAPRRSSSSMTQKRQLTNILLVVLNTALLRLLIPLAAVSTAGIAMMHGWGLFNWLAFPEWLEVLLCFLVLDMFIYFQHRLFHYIKPLWRLHRVHHSDTEFDVTTGLRFHPLEIILSMCIKMALVVALGAPVLAVILFEVMLNASSLFNHGNIRIPLTLDRYLRYIVVTPDMHRVHHSALKKETNSNFGFNLPWWDRLFASYRGQPEAGHEKLTIGLKEFRGTRFVNVLWLLKQPALDSAEYTDDSIDI